MKENPLIIDENNLGYEVEVSFPRIVRNSQRYQDITWYEYEVQYMFSGNLYKFVFKDKEKAIKKYNKIKENMNV